MRLAALLILTAGLVRTPAQTAQWQLEKVATGFRYAGGLAWSRDGHLYIADGPAGQLLRYTPGHGTALVQGKLNGPAGLAVDDRGRILVCESGARRLVRLREDDSAETVASTFEGHKLNSPNEVVVRKDGEIFFSDPAFGSAGDSRELSFYGIFRVGLRGGVSALARWDKRSNGLALSPDGKLLYAASSDERAVRVFDLDHQGNASGERVLITGIDGVPNGLCTDDQGRLYVAARHVLIFTPDGRPAGKIVLPEKPASLAFGGDDRRTLYIAARTSVYSVRLTVRE
ncbi:MAG: SMP-30/gluconolactonase/LRE family protein [Bryobacteraceae bacterium]